MKFYSWLLKCVVEYLNWGSFLEFIYCLFIEVCFVNK